MTRSWTRTYAAATRCCALTRACQSVHGMHGSTCTSGCVRAAVMCQRGSQHAGFFQQEDRIARRRTGSPNRELHKDAVVVSSGSLGSNCRQVASCWRPGNMQQLLLLPQCSC
jgi:hypothetical protein